MKPIAEAIVRLRTALNLTQEQLAAQLGATVSSVNRWERGWRTPSRLALRALIEFAHRNGEELHLTMPEPEEAEEEDLKHGH